MPGISCHRTVFVAVPSPGFPPFFFLLTQKGGESFLSDFTLTLAGTSPKGGLVCQRPLEGYVYVYVSFTLCPCGLWLSGKRSKFHFRKKWKSPIVQYVRNPSSCPFAKDQLFNHTSGMPSRREIPGFWYPCLSSASGIFACHLYLFCFIILILVTLIISAIRL